MNKVFITNKKFNNGDYVTWRNNGLAKCNMNQAMGIVEFIDGDVVNVLVPDKNNDNTTLLSDIINVNISTNVVFSK